MATRSSFCSVPIPMLVRTGVVCDFRIHTEGSRGRAPLHMTWPAFPPASALLSPTNAYHYTDSRHRRLCCHTAPARRHQSLQRVRAAPLPHFSFRLLRHKDPVNLRHRELLNHLPSLYSAASLSLLRILPSVPITACIPNKPNKSNQSY
jgi:hypothetical protein